MIEEETSISEEMMYLQKQFNKLVSRTCDYLSTRDKEIPNFLSALCKKISLINGSQRQLHIQLFSEYELQKLNEAKTVEDIFAVLVPHWDYLNYMLLKHIIEEFGDKILKEDLKSYANDLFKFCSLTLVKDFPGWREVSSPHFSTLLAKFKVDSDIYTLEDFEVDQAKLAVCLDLDQMVLKFSQATIGSLNIFLSLPRHLVPHTVSSCNTSALEDIKIISITVDGLEIEAYQHLLKV